MSTTPRTIVLLLALLAPAIASAQWMPIADADLVAQSELIVTGKVVAIQAGPVDLRCTDRAEIEVDQTLKGTPGGSKVLLVFPGKLRGYLDSAGRFVSTALPTEFGFELEQEGIWFLRPGTMPGTWVASHPARFKPLVLLPQVLSSLTAP